jgi:hypothetical protein
MNGLIVNDIYVWYKYQFIISGIPNGNVQIHAIKRMRDSLFHAVGVVPEKDFFAKGGPGRILPRKVAVAVSCEYLSICSIIAREPKY